MTTFIDTSALYALLDEGDENHRPASRVWGDLRARRERLVTTNYVLVETVALVGRRLGVGPVREFQTDFVPVLHPVWIDEATHDRAIAALLTAAQRRLSLVDCVSFDVMRQLGLQAAFVFDEHFVERGFDCMP